jgi:glutamine phosphoribosylpyrophosphate amidotransferase
MCALFGSANRITFNLLAYANSHRGTHSHSVFISDSTNSELTSQHKNFGTFTMPDTYGDYYHGHCQAPTTAATTFENIHPSSSALGTHLWHNGILFDSYVKELQAELDTDEKWDTKLLHNIIDREGLEVLSEVKGSFACVYYNGYNFYLFRNENCPLYTDGFSYSSTKFDRSEPIDPDRVYRLTNSLVIPTETYFKTAQEFFWSPE